MPFFVQAIGHTLSEHMDCCSTVRPHPKPHGRDDGRRIPEQHIFNWASISEVCAIPPAQLLPTRINPNEDLPRRPASPPKPASRTTVQGPQLCKQRSWILDVLRHHFRTLGRASKAGLAVVKPACGSKPAQTRLWNPGPGGGSTIAIHRLSKWSINRSKTVSFRCRN